MKQLAVVITMFSIACVSVTTYATSVPRGVAADKHIKVVQYDPNNVVLLKGRYGYQTQIAFAPNEVVQNVSLGDSMAWQVVPVGNSLFIKPVAQSNTNMTVITNSNSYNFQLDSSDAQVLPTYKLQFTYSDASFDQGSVITIPTINHDQVNKKYSYTGDKSLVPLELFDDGRFTYFKFKQDGMSRLPAVYTVDKNREESIVNYRMQDGYMIVNTIAKQFTLRNGAEVTSIYNDLEIGDYKHVH